MWATMAVRIVNLIIMVLESGSNLVLNALKLKGWKLEREQKKVIALGVSIVFLELLQYLYYPLFSHDKDLPQ